MDRLIDWPKLVDKLRSEIEEILDVDNDIMNNKDVVFH